MLMMMILRVTGGVPDREMVEDDKLNEIEMEGGSGRSAAARKRVRHVLLAQSLPASVGGSCFPGSGSSDLSP